jgi:hypothetical protein
MGRVAIGATASDACDNAPVRAVFLISPVKKIKAMLT